MTVVDFMSRNELSIDTFEEEPPLRTPSEAELRLRIYSVLLSRCFLAMLAIFVAVTAGSIAALFLHFRAGIVVGDVQGNLSFHTWTPLDYLSLSPEEAYFKPHDYPLVTCILVAPLLLVAATPIGCSLWYISQLFVQYSKGNIFREINTRTMRRIGHSLMACGYIPMFCVPLCHLIGVVQPSLAITKEMLLLIFFGLVFLSISKVLEIGWNIQKENEEIL